MQYSAYFVEEKDGSFSASISKLDLEKPAEGFIQINVSHSSLNYKDALSASGNKGVTRNYPFVPGLMLRELLPMLILRHLRREMKL